MSNSSWYESESWYAPLRREPEKAPEPEKKKGKTWPWVLCAVVLTLAVVVGLSLALRDDSSANDAGFMNWFGTAARDGGIIGSQERSPGRFDNSIFGGDDDEDPEDYRTFFGTYYTSEETESVEVNIPRSEDRYDFNLALNSAPERDLSLRELYERCSPSVVGISGYKEGMIGYNWGTGVIISADGLIITNTHVIDDCDRATVTLYDDREYEAKLVGFDSISDIALLKIEAEDLPAAVFGDSADIYVGQSVAAIGNPLGEEFRMTMTDGIISAISRDINYRGRTMTLMQTNAALNEGNSGGPLFNMRGQVIGITNMKMMSSASTVEGIGFAIPTSTVLGVVNGILQDGKVVGRVSIGITIGPIPESAMEDYDLPAGLYIVTVSPGSDAAEKGLQPGDILMEVNGQKVTKTAEVAAIKDQFSVGDELLFRIWRSGEILEVSVALVDTNDVYG